jgi:hypothetical protein
MAVDFAGPFVGTSFLVVVDTHSKWPEVFEMMSFIRSLWIARASGIGQWTTVHFRGVCNIPQEEWCQTYTLCTLSSILERGSGTIYSDIQTGELVRMMEEAYNYHTD